MTDDFNEATQERVIALVNQIMAVMAGVDEVEAKTALTLAVVSMIVSTSDGDAECHTQAMVFTGQVLDYADRRDIVEWIKAATSWSPVSNKTQ